VQYEGRLYEFCLELLVTKMIGPEVQLLISFYGMRKKVLNHMICPLLWDYCSYAITAAMYS
jgi:hypothetical protein